MEKISRIVPASKRQVWQTGEVDRPKRVADPVPEEAGVVKRAPISALDVLKANENPNLHEQAISLDEGGPKGNRINLMA